MKKWSVLGIVLAIIGMLLMLASPILAEGPVHWTYEGEEGPEHWGDLAPEFALCATGTEQSPVDIPGSAAVNPADIAFNYQPSALNILNNGHTIQVNYDAGSSMTVGGKTYDLAQFHFHIPSEHELGGSLTNMELHLVHKANDGELAVVGVMLNAGQENAALAPVFSHMPAQVQEAAPVSGVTVNATDFLPAEQTYYRYNGSLTTPPCTQGVKWHVLNTPVEMSQAQIDAFKAIFAEDARPVQPLNARAFLIVSTLPTTGANWMFAQMTWFIMGLLITLSGIGVLVSARRKTL